MIRAVLAAFLLAFTSVAAAQDATLARARQLIDAKQPKEAFALLSPLESERAGDPNYDYLLGLAALDAGELTRAVFALERVLAVQPNHPQARAEIARAYFMMKEDKVARAEFEAVKRARPPAEVAETIDKFIDALDARERSRGTGVSGYLEIGLGHDTNANAATGSTSFAIPAFAGLVFNLAPGAAKRSDEFWTIAGGVNGRYRINDTVSLIGNASFDKRMNSSLDQFDTQSLNGGGGVAITRDKDEFTIAFQAQEYRVDNNRFRDAAGLVGQWRRAVTANDQLTVYAQRTRLTYPGQTARNAERTVIGGAWAHSYGGRRSPVSFIGVYGGEEDELGQGVPQFGHRVWGGRIGGQVSLTDQWVLSGTLSYEDRRYGGPDPLFLVNRHDKETQARIAGVYTYDRNWSVSPSLTLIDNRSNIVVNAYDRVMLAVTVRYSFR